MSIWKIILVIEKLSKKTTEAWRVPLPYPFKGLTNTIITGVLAIPLGCRIRR